MAGAVVAGEFRVTVANAFCGWCGWEKPGAFLPCPQPACPCRRAEHDGCAGDGRCGDHPPYDNGEPGEPLHEPTWCQYYVSAGGGKSACAGHATAVVAAGAMSGIAVCDAHLRWALHEGAEARARGEI